MNCREVIHKLSEYLDGDLDPSLAETLRRHLAHCCDCRIIVDTTRKTIEIYCNTKPLPLPPEVHDRLMRAIAAKFSLRT